MNDIASVAISALIFRIVLTTPLMRPTIPPTTSPEMRPSAGPFVRATVPDTTAARPNVAPTERSMPPVINTMVPAAAMIRIDDC
ncbi:unannotated protein [freshwater metagenome]|uniref:Unannotated protein n=1 Tax=freshwater metagenome TaxID=449393 RepID=A0A6J6DMZ7_9ZZZZ